MEITVSKISFTLAVLIAIVCSTQADYLAFPRMGRSSDYLAFPRMGRAQDYKHISRLLARRSMKAESAAGCCGIGLKEETVLGQDGKEALRSICPIVDGDCCVDLKEIVDKKPDGSFYSMCVPEIPIESERR